MYRGTRNQPPELITNRGWSFAGSAVISRVIAHLDWVGFLEHSVHRGKPPGPVHEIISNSHLSRLGRFCWLSVSSQLRLRRPDHRGPVY